MILHMFIETELNLLNIQVSYSYETLFMWHSRSDSLHGMTHHTPISNLCVLWREVCGGVSVCVLWCEVCWGGSVCVGEVVCVFGRWCVCWGVKCVCVELSVEINIPCFSSAVVFCTFTDFVLSGL